MLPDRLAELALALDLTTATTPAGVGRRGCWVSWPGGIAGCWCSTTPRIPAPCASTCPRARPGADHLPQPGLATVRRHGGGAGVHPRESIALLHRLAPDLTEVEADRVAEAVGDLPLAVEQAGSLLADTGLTVDKYLRLLAERARDVLDHDPGGAYPQSVAASWAVAFDRLADDDPTALDLLTVVAWCGPEPVPLLCSPTTPTPSPSGCGRSPPTRWCWRAARDPAPAGMATVSPHGIQLHRIPAALLRARSQGSEVTAAAGWATTVVRLLDQTAPGNVRTDPGGWPLWRRLLPHVLAAAGRDVALDTVPAEATDPRSRRDVPIHPWRAPGRRAVRTRL